MFVHFKIKIPTQRKTNLFCPGKSRSLQRQKKRKNAAWIALKPTSGNVWKSFASANKAAGRQSKNAACYWNKKIWYAVISSSSNFMSPYLAMQNNQGWAGVNNTVDTRWGYSINNNFSFDCAATNFCLQEKQKEFLAKQQQQSEHRSRDQTRRSTYAFGSSTPRTLAYLQHLDHEAQVYNNPLKAPGGPADQSEMLGSPPASQPKPPAAASLRRNVAAASTPDVSGGPSTNRQAKSVFRVPKPPPAPGGPGPASRNSSVQPPRNRPQQQPVKLAHAGMTASVTIGDLSAGILVSILILTFWCWVYKRRHILSWEICVENFY